MSEQRRPTTRLGRKKDPRVDTLPPAPPLKGKMSEELIPRVEPLRKFSAEAKVSFTSPLEERLAREKIEREADAAKIGTLLARATNAEEQVRELKATVEYLEAQLLALKNEKNAIETRAMAMRGTRTTERELRLLDASADLPMKKTEAMPTLATARAMAAELANLMEKLTTRESRPSTLPPPRSARG